MDKSEKRFEFDIEQYLITRGGYEQFSGQSPAAPDGVSVWVHNRRHDVNRCIYMDVLCEFIATTQPKEWARYTKYYGPQARERLYLRLEQTITNEGLLRVLRDGIKDMGITLKVCYFKPESGLNESSQQKYAANILGCTRQFRYSPNSENTIDMVLSVNGIPVAALELKNQFKGQTFQDGIKQYQEDRSSKEFCFRLDHRFLVYFAVDLNEVWMTTRLKDGETRFVPFNQGSNGPGVSGGAGNPANAEGFVTGYPTSYLWERVLCRDSLLDLLHRFIVRVPEDKEEEKHGVKKTVKVDKIYFPRYHQYDVVHRVLDDVRAHGAGRNYLIQHSAGSGKTESIAWMAYRLACVHDEEDRAIFDSVIIVTNRIVLDSQLQDTILNIEHEPGWVEAIDNHKNSGDLTAAVKNRKRMIICTVQKFLFAWKDLGRFRGRRFAIMIDEAHQGESGKTAAALRRALIDIGIAVRRYAEEEGIEESEVDLTEEYINAVISQGKQENQSFFAFTATPGDDTLEKFGEFAGYYPNGKARHVPFHVYSMRQAIEEGFILNVLEHYTTIQKAFRLVRVSEDNPELIEGLATRALFRYYKKHGHTIAQKTEIMMSNFLENGRLQIGGRGKCMVVADSRANAVRYYFAIRRYLEEHPKEAQDCGVMIAFSGEVTLDDYPSEKPYTEAAMNRDAKGRYITTDKAFRKAFRSGMYNILVVADKYQTGFDEPLLHTMYVDKKLRGIAAVQTLSRLNRKIHGKNSTFVLDFENEEKDIRDAFAPFYDTTVLSGETDINRVYDLRSKIAGFMLYGMEDVEAFAEFMRVHAGKAKPALGRLISLFRPVIERYLELNEDDRFTVRDLIQQFDNAYSYVTQLVSLHDRELFHEYQFTTDLIRLLPMSKNPFVDIEDKVRMEYAYFSESFSGQIVLDGKTPVLTPNNSLKPKKPVKKKDTLQSIIDRINERYGGHVTTPGDETVIASIYGRFMESEDVRKYRQYAEDNSPEMFVRSLFPDKFKEIVTKCYQENYEAFEKLFRDPDFYQKVMEEMADALYQDFRKG